MNQGSTAVYPAKSWGRAVRISEAALSPKVLFDTGKILLDRTLNKTALRRYISRKHYPIRSTVEFSFKRPGPVGIPDPYSLACILAVKFKTVRFSKLKKLKRDCGFLFEKSDYPEKELAALVVAIGKGGPENSGL